MIFWKQYHIKIRRFNSFE